MNCRLIFYNARKTALCERSLKKSFSELNLTLENTAYATDRTAVGSQLIATFKGCDIAFLVGGLGAYNANSSDKIISAAVSGKSTDDVKKLKNESGDDGYVVRLHRQMIILLPDEPQQIEYIMQGAFSSYIKKQVK